MVDKPQRPRVFGKREGDPAPKVVPERAGPDAPIAGMFANSVKGLSTENARLKDQLATAEMLIKIDPSEIEEGLVSDRDPIGDADESFLELQSSIESRGQDQPITVRRKGEGRGYELIAGRRRVRACQNLGLQVIARVQDLDDRSALANMWAENNIRLKPAPLELGTWLSAVMSKYGLKQTDLIEITGYKAPQLSKLVKIGRDFPAEVRSILIDPREVSQNSALGLIDRWGDKEGRKAVLSGLDRASKLNDTARQVDFLLAVKVAEKPTSGQSERIALKDRSGKRRGSIVRSAKGLKIELDGGIPEMVAREVIGIFERIVQESFPQETE